MAGIFFKLIDATLMAIKLTIAECGASAIKEHLLKQFGYGNHVQGREIPKDFLKNLMLIKIVYCHFNV